MTTRLAPFALLIAFTAPASAGFVADGGFESPTIAPNSYEYEPSGSPWTFVGQSGIVNGTNALGQVGQDGSQAAFLQGGSEIEQTITVTGSLYNLMFEDENGGGVQEQFSLIVTLNGGIIGSDTPSSTSSFKSNNNMIFSIPPGTYTFDIVNRGNSLIFIDDIDFVIVPIIVTIPEPSSLLLLCGGLLIMVPLGVRSRKP
jgi:hypothetical protein